MSVSQTAPSPFAALLRRSKFVSFDPNIGQVYTTHGGHAFRGDWGLKRPLANRRRSGFITVQKIDSPEQQTEWRSGEDSARWMRRWEEIGKKLEISEMGPWRSKTIPGNWHFDTEFDRTRAEDEFRESPELEEDDPRNLHDAASIAYQSVPNPDAMTPRRFEKYLGQLRDLRPEFKRYLYKKWEKHQKKRRGPLLRSEIDQIVLTGSGDVHMLMSAQYLIGKYVSDFLKDKAQQELKSPASTRIVQCPHPLAGLEYASMSILQSKYLHKPSPGRCIAYDRPKDPESKPKNFLATVGGLVGSIPTNHSNILPVDFGTQDSPRLDREQGKAYFRMTRVELERAPGTVGSKPRTATDTRFRTVQFLMHDVSGLSNPHHLGSPEYVSQMNNLSSRSGQLGHHPEPTNLTRKVIPSHPTQDNEKENSAELISSLTKLISAKIDNPVSR